MKKVISLFVMLTAFSAYAQIQAVPAPPNPEEETAATEQALQQTEQATSDKAREADPMTAIMATPPVEAPVVVPETSKTTGIATVSPTVPLKPAVKSVTQTKKVQKPKSPWGGSLIADASRQTDINHSKILDPDSPDKRTDYSLTFIGVLNYKASDKNSFFAAQGVSRDIVRNADNASENEFSVSNLRVGWTRATDFKILGSSPIGIPLSVSLPTSYASRAAGSLGSVRFKPVVYWELNPTWSLTFVSETHISFSSPVDQEYKDEQLVENAKYLMSNSLTLGANLTDTFSISQTLGISSTSKNLRNPIGADQTGASLDVSTGASWMATPAISIDVSVNQSAPFQGNGNDSVQVYENNQFRLYHVAQTTYGLSATYTF